MKAGIIVQDNFPVGRQVRTKRIAKAIDDDSGEAVVFARNTQTDPARGNVDDERRPHSEVLPYAAVRRFSWLSSTQLGGVATAPLPVNLLWALWLVIEFSRYDIDVAVAGDLRAGLPTILAARIIGIPVALDLREHYTGLAQTLPHESPIDYIVQNERLVGALERATVALADEVWVVVAERRDSLIDRGVPPEKLTVVSNTPTSPDRDAGSNARATATDDGGEAPADEHFNWSAFTLVYVGVLNEFRGLDLILDAIAHLYREGDEAVHLAVAGEGPYRMALERRCRTLGIADQVTFLGWIDSDRVPTFLASGDVGVIPHRVTPLTEYTVPNKLFDYMRAELPVLTRDVTPISRIVEAEDCGYVLPPDATPAETAAQIRQLQSADATELGVNGCEAIESRYNWRRDADRMLTSLERLVGPECDGATPGDLRKTARRERSDGAGEWWD